MIGVLGGGQLGAMFAAAARRLGYRIAVWDPDPEAPALRLAHLPIAAPFADAPALAHFAGAVSAVTYEWENVPFSVGRDLEERVPVRPSPSLLRLLQNRISQKAFLLSRNFPVAPFHAVHTPHELAVPDEIGYPALCKTATSGYDGKGQWRINGPADAERLRHLLPADNQWVVERLLTFEKELSIVVARATGGEIRSYPVAENVHEGGILRTSRIPAVLQPHGSEEVRSLAHAVVEALDGVGVFCIEMFLLSGGRLLINEVAPRPHNSGHYTLDACSVSQFEQQVRALCELPLGEIRLLSPAAMVNLLGDEIGQATSGAGLKHVLGVPGAKLRVYGKTTIRPGRKMGHVTFLDEQGDRAWESAMALRRLLAGAAGDVLVIFLLCALIFGGAAGAASREEEESAQTFQADLDRFQRDNRGRELSGQQANLARYDARRGDRAGAINRLQRALELAGQIQAIGKRTVALVQIATVQGEVGDNEGALKTANTIESLTERDSTLRTIALDRAKAGDLDSAKLFAAAIQDSSKRTDAVTYIEAQLSARPLGY